ncbi:MAG: preprotein translocase subunit SecE [Pseudomonadota bacterium]
MWCGWVKFAGIVMVSKTEVQESRGDVVKHVLALAIVVAALAAFYVYAEESLLYRVLGVLAALGVAVAIFYQTDAGRQLWAFGQAARTEVRKVVWPTRAETLQTTLIVFVIVLLIGLFLWLLDLMLGSAFQMVTGAAGG